MTFYVINTFMVVNNETKHIKIIMLYYSEYILIFIVLI